MRSKSAVQKKKETYERGVWAEGLAALYLLSKGYAVLERRYRTKYGEIDLIARKGDMVCFVEVKARASLGEAMESVTPRARGRIENAALSYIADHPESAECAMRFDVVAVIPPLRVVHLDNAWEARS